MYRFEQSETRLRRVFEEGFSARDIASALASFDGTLASEYARAVMFDQAYHVAGVRVDGRIAGYVDRDSLTGGSCADHLHPFDPGEVVDDSASFSQVVSALDGRMRVFVRAFGEVGGLVTRTDLEKPPVRMWLFGMISLIEMTMTRAIEDRFPHESWVDSVSAGRRGAAENLLRERRRIGQDVRLLDCLQFSDKLHVLLRLEDIRCQIGAPSMRAAKESARMLESLRNNLAHSQGIVSHDWPTIVRIAEDLDATLSRLNGLEGNNQKKDPGTVETALEPASPTGV